MTTTLVMVPTMEDKVAALRHVASAADVDPVGFLQQSVCFDWYVFHGATLPSFIPRSDLLFVSEFQL